MQREQLPDDKPAHLQNSNAYDQELLVRIQRGDEAALGLLYDRYDRFVYTIALRITGDRVIAEEVVQDVFLAVWQSAGSYQPTYPVIAWLIGITRHRAIDATRSRQSRARARETGLDRANRSVRDSAADPMAHSTLRQIVQQALGALSPGEREVIALAYYGGLTRVEIAAQLGQPLGTVKSRLRTALLKLRDAVQRAEE